MELALYSQSYATKEIREEQQNKKDICKHDFLRKIGKIYANNKSWENLTTYYPKICWHKDAKKC